MEKRQTSQQNMRNVRAIALDILLQVMEEGKYYGTPKKAVTDMLEQGRDVILKIEVEGAMNIKKIFPECVLIFILPPSMRDRKSVV